MSAYYEQDTSLQISVNLPSSTRGPSKFQQGASSDDFYFKSPDQSYHSSQFSASSGTNTNSVFSSPRENPSTTDTSSFYTGLDFGITPPKPHPPDRKPPIPPKRGQTPNQNQSQNAFHAAMTAVAAKPVITRRPLQPSDCKSWYPRTFCAIEVCLNKKPKVCLKRLRRRILNDCFELKCVNYKRAAWTTLCSGWLWLVSRPPTHF